MAGTDPRVYETQEDTLPPLRTSVTEPPELPPVQTVQAGDVLAVTPSGQRAKAVQAQARMEEKAGVLASVEAAISHFDTVRLFEAATSPDFEPDGTDPYAALQHVPFQLTEAEMKRWGRTNSVAERAWLTDRWQDDRRAAQVAGDHPIVSTITGVFDPAYLVAGGAIGVTSRVFKGVQAARAFGAVTQGAAAYGIATSAAEVAPVSNTELALNVLLNAAGGAVISKEGKLVQKHPEYPAKAVQQSLDQFYKTFVGPAPFGVEEVTKQSFRSVTRDGKTVIVQQPDTTFRRVVEGPLAPGAPAAERSVVAQTVDTELEHHAKTWAQRFGEKILWNMHKTLRGDGSSPARAKIADLLFDDNTDLAKNSLESEKRVVHAELVNFQHAYEADLRAVMAQEGHGSVRMLLSSPATRAKQAQLERDVYVELLRREQLFRQGRAIDYTGVPENIKKLADRVQFNTGRAADEMRNSKMLGAEELQTNPGYIPRVWNQSKIDTVTAKLVATGLTQEAAHQHVVKLVQQSLRKANPTMDADDAYHVASSIINRTLRKGYGEDSAFKSAFGKGTKEQVRDELKSLGVPHDRLDRVMKILGADVDEAGKASFLKHRMDLDYTVKTKIGGEEISVVDLLETNVSTLLDRYNHRVAGRVAFAKKGVNSTSDLQKLRDELARGTSDAERKQVLELFDGGVNDLMGLPTGQSMNDFLRNTQGYNRMITLGASGLWQVTEYATMMAKYGGLKTLKYAMQEMPVFRSLMETGVKDKLVSRQLKDILENLAEQNLRMRPYIAKFEDGFDIPVNERHTLMIQQGTQLVPYLNMMKYVHSHQARIAANHIIDSMQQGARGSAKHRQVLEKYGVPSQVWDNLRKSVDKAGLSVDDWDDGVWEAVRPAFAKMMDEAVLHQRLGDTPAFAKLDNVGKFIFTYRSFILTAHNKILSGTLSRDGMLGMTALMAYQFPLSMLATQANAVLSGKGPLKEDELILKSIGQMGALGLGTEAWGWLSGQKREFGSPGLIPFDRAITAAGSTSSAIFGDGSAGKAVGDAASLIPLVNILPGFKGLEKLAE